MSWKIEQTAVTNGCKFRIKVGAVYLSRQKMLELMASNDEFADWYTQLLVATNYPAAYWEHPPLTKSALNLPAEFVVLDAPSLLNKRSDQQTFADHFDIAANVAVFPSLGKDALLIAPCPVKSKQSYRHLLEFLRTAPVRQIHDLWRTVGEESLAAVATRPFWLSTSGLGVPWLHIRLDSTPKYYQHEPYKTV
jgi:hypothetical protein